MSFIRKILLLGIFWVLQPIYAQDDWEGVLQPQLVLRNTVSGNYNQLWRWTHRFTGLDSQEDFQMQFIDVTHFSTLAISDNQRIGLGLQYRFQENFDPGSGNEFRLTEQFIWKYPRESGTITQRIRAEQRIFSQQTLHRFRYRLSRDIPLQGEDLNRNESYVVGHFEPLITVSDGRGPRYDQRFTVGVGWLLGAKTVWLTNLEYRLENYTRDTHTRIFLITSLNISL